MPNYAEIAKEVRLKVLDLIYKAQTSHIGSNFSCIDVLTVLFEKADPKKDEIILSAGWKAAAWYYFLWKKGVISEDELNSFCQPGSSFIGLTEPMNRWGLRFGGGSMGLGLPAAVGFALAKKLKSEDGTVYVLMSDGEMQCGTTWESALIAAQHELENLVVIIDNNGFQAMGKTEDILPTSFPGWATHDKKPGWKYRGASGHDFEKIEQLLNIREEFKLDMSAYKEPRPTILNFGTIKGKGVSFMENNNTWHYKAPSEEEYNLALKELQ